MIRNSQAEALTSNLTPTQLGQAMQQLDLSTIPPHKRADAIRDHLMRIMADSIHDRSKATEIHAARYLHAKRQGRTPLLPS